MKKQNVMRYGAWLIAFALPLSVSAGDVERGAALWTQAGTVVDGKVRTCATCHGKDPTAKGRHIRTGKTIEPMAPRVQADRLSDPAKIDKWFRRNCKWTWGRECSADEKSDFIVYLRAQ